MLEDGIYKIIGAIVIAVFFFILVCRLLGFQARLIEGFGMNSLGDRKKDSAGSGGSGGLFGSDDSGTPDEAANHQSKKAKSSHHQSKAGHGELRQGQEKQIESLDEALRAEILAHVLNKTKDKNGNWTNPLHTGGNLLDNPDAMNLIMKLNEMWKFRDTLEAAIHTLDNTTATNVSSIGGGIV